MSNEEILIIAFIYSTFIAAPFIHFIIRLMWTIHNFPHDKDVISPYYWQSCTVGIIERSLYLLSILIQKPEFIAVWLTLKTVSQAKSWSKDYFGRPIYNNFLAGNGLSILFAFAGAGIVQWTAGPILQSSDKLKEFPPIMLKNICLALFAGITPIVLSVILITFLFIVFEVKKQRYEEQSRSAMKAAQHRPNGRG